jgi:hypothetical protein
MRMRNQYIYTVVSASHPPLVASSKFILAIERVHNLCCVHYPVPKTSVSVSLRLIEQ